MWYVSIGYDPFNQHPPARKGWGFHGYACKTGQAALKRLDQVIRQGAVSSVFARYGTRQFTYNELEDLLRRNPKFGS